MEMITVFLISLFSTFILVRIAANFLHDKKGYLEGNEHSKTLTALLRHWTGLDIHHIHLGILAIAIVSIAIVFRGPETITVMGLAMSLSLIFDQVTMILTQGNRNSYFSYKSLLLSTVFQFVLAGLALWMSRVN